VQRTAVVAAARARIGTPYSAADYFAIAAHRFHLPVPWLRAYVASSKHLICSALVDRVFLDAGVPLFQDGRWEGYVTPASLDELIR
jgi:phosphoglucomutase